jgi:hypothetical protein
MSMKKEVSVYSDWQARATNSKDQSGRGQQWPVFGSMA